MTACTLRRQENSLKLLDNPAIYLALQATIGAKKARRLCIEQFAKPIAGQRVLDVGCGPGFVIEYMPKVDYVGTDIDHRYIAHAKDRYGDRGAFHCTELNRHNIGDFGQFDLVLLNGVLHHINDEAATELLRLIRDCLRPGGKLMTLDGCFYEKMSPISRFLISHDRGEYVRRETEYIRLASEIFTSVVGTHRKDLFSIPYDSLVMVCRSESGDTT